MQDPSGTQISVATHHDTLFFLYRVFLYQNLKEVLDSGPQGLNVPQGGEGGTQHQRPSNMLYLCILTLFPHILKVFSNEVLMCFTLLSWNIVRRESLHSYLSPPLRSMEGFHLLLNEQKVWQFHSNTFFALLHLFHYCKYEQKYDFKLHKDETFLLLNRFINCFSKVLRRKRQKKERKSAKRRWLLVKNLDLVFFMQTISENIRRGQDERRHFIINELIKCLISGTMRRTEGSVCADVSSSQFSLQYSSHVIESLYFLC